jgi:acetyltransferase-like isoleucine patch superfamily enzyme
MIQKIIDTPWKLHNEAARFMAYPWVRLLFAIYRIPWGKHYRFYGVPILQKHRRSTMTFGDRLQLRSNSLSNPLGINHPVVLATMKAGAVLKIGNGFSMSGGAICTAEEIQIGNNVAVGANSTIVDTDFHSLDPYIRIHRPLEANTRPVHIEDEVFIGTACLIMKGVTIGKGSVIGAGSVVTRNIPAGVIAAGVPAVPLRQITFPAHVPEPVISF